MRIIMLADAFPPSIGGLGQHVYNLSCKLAEKGHHILVITGSQLNQKKREFIGDIEVLRLKTILHNFPRIYSSPFNALPPPFTDKVLVKNILKYIDNDFDLIHAHGWILYSGHLLKKKLKLPLISTIHDYGYICPKRTLLTSNYTICDRMISKSCINCGIHQYGSIKSLATYFSVKLQLKKLVDVDQYLAVSPFVKKMHQKYINEKNLSVLPNFYIKEKNQEKSNFNVKEEFQNLNSDPTEYYLYAGNISREKGFHNLITAHCKLKQRMRLVLVGATPIPSKESKYYKKENIVLFKNLEHEKVLSLMKNAQFVVTPSIWAEPCPTVILEAMSLEKPVIGTPVGGIPFIIQDKVTGMILPSQNSVSNLKNAIQHLQNNETERKNMGKNGLKRFIQNFESSRVINLIEKKYKQLM